MEGGLLSLRWNDHGSTFFDMLSSIRRKEAFCDVTLVCEGRYYPVHKLVLLTCSDFFENLFCRTDCKHPIIIVANVLPKDLEALLNYMYLGEVNVLQTELPDLMRAADVLRIKGLAEPKNANKESSERKRSSGVDASDSIAKRRRSEDAVNSSRRLSPEYAVEKNHANELGRPRSSTSSQVSKRSAYQKNLPSSSSSNTGSVIDTQEKSVLPNASYSNSQQSHKRDVDNLLNSKDLRPEVKVEEVLVKDEGDDWFDGSDEGLDALQFNESEGSTDFNSGVPGASVATPYSGGCLQWDLGSSSSPSQSHPSLDGHHLPLEMTSASSGMQGMQEFGLLRSSLIQLERSRRYEATKRSRHFVESWRKEFPWVHYDAQNKVMTCTTCLKYSLPDEKSRFLSGNCNFKRLALVRHEVSAVHQRSIFRKEADSATLFSNAESELQE